MPVRGPAESAAAGDPAGRHWQAGLPMLTARLAARWGLQLEDGVAGRGWTSVVLPARRDGEPCVLRLSWPTGDTDEQVGALAAWAARGAVRLLAADTELGAMLLERLDPGRSLRDLPVTDAAAAAGALLRRLAVPAPAGFRQLPEIAADLAAGLPERQARLRHPVPRIWLEQAADLAAGLAAHSGSLLVHADLHYQNVLAGAREPWLAIDPRPVCGDPELAVAELLWTRLDEVDGPAGLRRLLAVLTDSGGLDPAKARAWAVVRCVDYWLWGLEHGLTDDPVRCHRILAVLA